MMGRLYRIRMYVKTERNELLRKVGRFVSRTGSMYNTFFSCTVLYNTIPGKCDSYNTYSRIGGLFTVR